EVGAHGGQVVESLRPAQAGIADYALAAPHVHGALTPAHPLSNERLDRFGCETECKRLAMIDGALSGGVQADRGMQILGDGAGGKTAHAFKRAAADQRATAAEEC